MNEWTWQWWLNVQTVPGNLVPELLLGGAGYLLGRFHLKRHTRRTERQHQERIDQAADHHQEQLAQAEQHHQEQLAHRERIARHSPARMPDDEFEKFLSRLRRLQAVQRAAVPSTNQETT